MYIVTKDEMANADSYTINQLGISGDNLMESAAQAITEKLIDVFNQDRKLVVLAGVGNNGGDGIAIARRLLNLGYNAELWLIPPEELVRGEAKAHLEIYKRHGYKIHGYSDGIFTAISNADGIVDALLGNGSVGEPRNPYDIIIKAVNASEAVVASVDLPSGINANSAQTGTAIKADFTYMIQCAKCSCFLYPAAEYYGNWKIVDIGIPSSALKKPLKLLWDESEYKNTIVSRLPNSHKGNNGKALIIGGSSHMIGAPVLSAQACLCGGIGLLSSAVPSNIMPVMASSTTESTFVECEENSGNITAVHYPDQIDVIAIGMGLGRSKETLELVKSTLDIKAPVILDADSLFFLPKLWEYVDDRDNITIVTPHMGEMARLCDISVEKVENSRFDVARNLATKHKIYVVLKGPYTIVTTPKGEQYVNASGNAGLAKGGSGDVLTGLIAGMLPRYESPQHAISNAVYMHGKAADTMLDQGYCIDSITPTELIKQLHFIC